MRAVARRTLPEAWVERWRADPGAVVLVDPSGVRVTAAMLEEWSAGVARRLAAAGVGPQDRVLLSAEPSVDLVVAYVALLRLGAVVVPTNTAYTGPELAHLVEDARPVLAVADRPDRFAAHDLAVVGPHVSGTDAGPVPLDRAGPDDLAWLCYTSGTTGRPKGAMLTHANLLAGADAVVDAWAWAADDVLVLALPLFHMHGLGVGINGTLTAGAAAVVLPRFDVDAVLDARETYGGTLFFGVPTMYARLVESPRLAELGGFRLAVSGSAPLSPDLWERVRTVSGVEILERYGMTETVMLCTNPLTGQRVPGSVGRPVPGVELRLGVDGAVEVRGPAVFAGYWERPEATKDALTDDGWFRTGDVGEWGGDGGLRLVGRTSELVITGGYNVYPREVEDAVRTHAAVADVAVVGVPDPTWGELVVAFVVPADPMDPPTGPDLAAAVEPSLAPYKHPRRWVMVDALPRNAMGKVLRADLLAQLPDETPG
jgi:malonyl-CoA/methylmalonyl-CoA synthetase